ncbi:carbon-nitrogen hydrolase family protein [Pseudomonas sp. CBSPBW29]|jgi:predicted amidohydrolase|uniref:carbon-nitrogen hydrolase family protein n=1 Tax=Pseudomonas TaxID=286 RepID=UPI0021ACCEBA|nr:MULTISPECIES: carbon-nitrogen hydrolase family protein [unclassified Pseudomonas]WEL42477.1 carbon-nitrogen hydrolase family protein [Pseudomonas sp. CBSPBW29]WEL63542.1 carbon-nitrogen hydrolase family protein [Pseudomonas sp. CBSPGW29]WEL72730.1 carbon-nitrogen hydrolase family protein [Pseudomonas sp. CBSPCGW29]WEL74042.1 carbon-nitrogen hydrolase family protein [Pseudomonas sp. CBSPAW29]WEL81716.1 carbon-nitrogen hydrolase family protein [Pseudomonas sp. CBSPCAW29]WEL90196.1 carbon-nit
MRKLLGFTLIMALVAAVSAYLVWTQERPVGHYLSDLRINLAVDQGVPADRGNLLGIQPELFPADYQSLERLHLKLAAYLQKARDQGLINDKTIVVLPEHIGTWLMVSGEKNELYQATNLKEAMNWLSASNPLLFLRALISAKGDDRIDDAYLRMKAPAMARDYQVLFGGLAKEFGVTLVAGSIALPNPSVSQGQLQIGHGALYNTSVVFDRDGLAVGQPQRQLYPIFDERGFIEPGDENSVSVVETPAGRLGILIGSDSWYPDNYRKLNEQGAQLVAVPAFVIGRETWDKPWRGFKSVSTPPEISLKPEELSEGEAWHRLTLISQQPISQATAGMSVFLRGQFFDMGSAGQSFLSSNGQVFADGNARGARLLNVWL